MQQPEGQAWNGGGIDRKWVGRAPLARPLATALTVSRSCCLQFGIIAWDVPFFFKSLKNTLIFNS